MTLKRILDVLIASLGLIVLFPALVAIAILIFLTTGRPIFFCQTRPGLHAKPFRLIKFNTMTDARDADGRFLPDEMRATSLGRHLRASSLDELPELWNVLKGEMSLVGPRPLLMEYLPLYSLEQSRRHHVKPGMTGWAQVNGRNAISWEEKFAYDIWYVDHRSFWLDIKILFLTLWKTVRQDGINEPGQATAQVFTGRKLP